MLANIPPVLLLIIIAFSPPGSSFWRVVLGLPLILFLPGYTLTAAVFPRKSSLSAAVRVALSFGLSIVLVPLMGYLLNYTPWGIQALPFLILLIIFMAVTSAVAWGRRWALPEEEIPRLSLTVSLPRWWQQGLANRVLFAILGTVILGSVLAMGYAVARPRTGERFTEFYILGTDGKVAYYPTKLKVGEEGRVTLTIVNHEGETSNYEIRVTMDGTKKADIKAAVANDEKWGKTVSFVPDKPGDGQPVEFLLYKDRSDEPYLELRLWVDVSG